MRAKSQTRALERKRAATAERMARTGLPLHGPAAQGPGSPAASGATWRTWRDVVRRLAVVAGRGGSPTAPALPVNSPDQPGRDAAPAGQAGVANPTTRQVLWEAYGEQSTRWFYDLMPRDLQGSEAAGGITSVRVGHPGGAASTVHCVGCKCEAIPRPPPTPLWVPIRPSPHIRPGWVAGVELACGTHASM